MSAAARLAPPPGGDKIMRGRPPFLLRWRSSTVFVTITVGLGVMTDLAGYGLIVPVIPFRLQELGYTDVGSKTGWLVSAYAAGLIVSSPPIAWAGNHFKGRRIPLLVALCFMAGAVVLFMETANFTAMIISRILQGISGTAIWTLGLALVTDSVPSQRIGFVMGQVMLGFTLGSLIGPPIGGVLYARLGYRAPFVFALCLLFFDFVLRILVVEKHVALAWIRAGVEIPGFEAPGYTPPNDLTKSEEDSMGAPAPIPLSGVNVSEDGGELRDKTPSAWSALLRMVTSARPLTNFGLTILNGIVLGGILDTGMTLWLQHQYNLTSLGAGLVFLAISADRIGAKWIAVAGISLSIPAYSLLAIPGPLPLFIFFLVLVGTSLSLFITPTMQDLSMIVETTPGLPSTAAYGCFNMCYSIGAFVGPLMAGQLIEGLEIRKGWIVMCCLSSGLSVLILPVLVLYLGGPLKWRARKEEDATATAQVAE